MNSRDRVLAALRREQPDRVPWVEGGVAPPLQRALMGRESFLPEELSERLGLDNVYTDFLPPIFADLEEQDGIPFVTTPRICGRADLKNVSFPDPEDPALYRDAEALVRRVGGRLATCTRMRLGVSPMLLSMGLEHFSYALADDPEVVGTLVARYADWTIAVLRHLRNSGIDYVWTFDDMAHKTGPMFSLQVLRKHFMPHLRRVAQAIKEAGFPWIFHSDGNLMALLDELLTLGFDGLHPIEPGPMEIESLKRDYGGRVCLVGNIDLHYTLTVGTPAEVVDEVRRRIAVVGAGGGYMISSANSLTAYCKLDNVWAMARAIQQYGPYPAARQ